MLVENKNQIVKRDIILKNIWGEDDYFLGRSMDVFISHLANTYNTMPIFTWEHMA